MGSYCRRWRRTKWLSLRFVRLQLWSCAIHLPGILCMWCSYIGYIPTFKKVIYRWSKLVLIHSQLFLNHDPEERKEGGTEGDRRGAKRGSSGKDLSSSYTTRVRGHECQHEHKEGPESTNRTRALTQMTTERDGARESRLPNNPTAAGRSTQSQPATHAREHVNTQNQTGNQPMVRAVKTGHNSLPTGKVLPGRHLKAFWTVFTLLQRDPEQ